jgi:hypothetical protein
MDHAVSISYPNIPENATFWGRLEAKLNEYKLRIAAAKPEPLTDNECFWQYNDRAKAIILAQVLVHGGVYRTDLFVELWINPETRPIVEYSHGRFGNPYLNAFAVILDYVENDGLNTEGGTGLPPPR